MIAALFYGILSMLSIHPLHRINLLIPPLLSSNLYYDLKALREKFSRRLDGLSRFL